MKTLLLKLLGFKVPKKKAEVSYLDRPMGLRVCNSAAGAKIDPKDFNAWATYIHEEARKARFGK